MTPKDKAADKRLQRLYGITLADYGRMLEEHFGGCWICGKKPKPGKRLSVDHDHAVRYYKVSLIWKSAGRWIAEIAKLSIQAAGDTKREAVRNVKLMAKRMSVRGLLDWRCNVGLQKWRDNPELMVSAACYLRAYKKRLHDRT